MAEMDLNAHVRGATEWAYQNFVNDLNALEETAASGSPDPRLRPAIKLVAECAAVNRALASLLATGSAPSTSPEEREAYYASITNRAEALAALESATQAFYDAVQGVPADGWGEEVQSFFGPASRLSAAGIAAMHMMYHDGQLNYLHMLNGDTEMHWK